MVQGSGSASTNARPLFEALELRQDRCEHAALSLEPHNYTIQTVLSENPSRGVHYQPRGVQPRRESAIMATNEVPKITAPVVKVATPSVLVE